MSATTTTTPDFVREHELDPITLDIIENTLSNARDGMDRVLETTAVRRARHQRPVPVISYQDDRAQTHSWGRGGGRHGAASAKTLVRAADGSRMTLPSKVENVPARRGDRLVFATAGAGGLGDPLTRELDRVATDVRAGLVSVEAARDDYGVVVSAAALTARIADERWELDAWMAAKSQAAG